MVTIGNMLLRKNIKLQFRKINTFYRQFFLHYSLLLNWIPDTVIILRKVVPKVEVTMKRCKSFHGEGEEGMSFEPF